MQAFRKHWYQVGFGLAIIILVSLFLWHDHLSSFRILLAISLVTLFAHQFEEYQFPGGFPHMLNRTLFNSKNPDRFPLNPNTALVINVLIGWLLYMLAFLFAQHAVWLAIASIMVSAGNVVAHVFLFNIKGRSFYNPGMATALMLFLPLTIYFFMFIEGHNLVSPASLIIGLILGLIINYFGVLRLITLLADKNTQFTFKHSSS